MLVFLICASIDQTDAASLFVMTFSPSIFSGSPVVSLSPSYSAQLEPVRGPYGAAETG